MFPQLEIKTDQKKCSEMDDTRTKEDKTHKCLLFRHHCLATLGAGGLLVNIWIIIRGEKLF